MHLTRKTWVTYAGIIWMFVFAIMSFYWAAGGMIGARSLGGEIYQMALDRDPEYIPIVWATGFIKLVGILPLLLFLSQRVSKKLKKWSAMISIVAGIFMALYGVLNFITISLAGLNILDFNLDAYAMWWRLLFWEPFWVLGGVLYVLAARNYDSGLSVPN